MSDGDDIANAKALLVRYLPRLERMRKSTKVRKRRQTCEDLETCIRELSKGDESDIGRARLEALTCLRDCYKLTCDVLSWRSSKKFKVNIRDSDELDDLQKTAKELIIGTIGVGDV